VVETSVEKVIQARIDYLVTVDICV